MDIDNAILQLTAIKTDLTERATYIDIAIQQLQGKLTDLFSSDLQIKTAELETATNQIAALAKEKTALVSEKAQLVADKADLQDKLDAKLALPLPTDTATSTPAKP